MLNLLFLKKKKQRINIVNKYYKSVKMLILTHYAYFNTLLLLCLFQTFALFTSADHSETADYNNLGNFLSCFK